MLIRSIMTVVTVLSFSLPAIAETNVRGYYRRDGTYVQPHTRSDANAYQWDNRSYTPSQPAYNSSYGSTNRKRSPEWYVPNQQRFYDDNKNNDYPSSYSIEPVRLHNHYDTDQE